MPSEHGSRDKWPTTRVDTSIEKDAEHTVVDTLDVSTVYQPNSNGRKKSSFLYQPDAYDERMYATYLTQKVVFTREYPYDAVFVRSYKI